MLLGWSRRPGSSSSEANNSMTKYSISTQPTANELTSTNWARLNSALHAISFLNCQKEETHVQIYCNCMSSEYLSHIGSQRQKLQHRFTFYWPSSHQTGYATYGMITGASTLRLCKWFLPVMDSLMLE